MCGVLCLGMAQRASLTRQAFPCQQIPKEVHEFIPQDVLNAPEGAFVRLPPAEQAFPCARSRGGERDMGLLVGGVYRDDFPAGTDLSGSKRPQARLWFTAWEAFSEPFNTVRDDEFVGLESGDVYKGGGAITALRRAGKTGAASLAAHRDAMVTFLAAHPNPYGSGLLDSLSRNRQLKLFDSAAALAAASVPSAAAALPVGAASSADVSSGSSGEPDATCQVVATTATAAPAATATATAAAVAAAAAATVPAPAAPTHRASLPAAPARAAVPNAGAAPGLAASSPAALDKKGLESLGKCAITTLCTLGAHVLPVAQTQGFCFVARMLSLEPFPPHVQAGPWRLCPPVSASLLPLLLTVRALLPCYRP